MSNIESLQYPANSIVGNQLNSLKERIEAQPHIETMTHYTDDSVNAMIDNKAAYYDSIDAILS